MADPLALVSRAGETLEANREFCALAENLGVEPRLEDLFGAAALKLLDRAVREGQARATLRLAIGPEPRPEFLLSLRDDGVEESVVALLVNLSETTGERRSGREQDLTMLREVGAALSGSVELDELTERIYAQTSRCASTANFYVALYDAESGTVSFPRYVEEGLWKSMMSRPFGNGLTEFVLRTGEPLVLNQNVAEECRARGVEPVGRPCRSWIGVPMLVDGEPIGVIGLQDYERSNRYDQHDVEVLSIIAGQAAAAIRNSRLLAAARRAYVELAEAQARLLESERVRGVTETVGALNHEVNNPLAAIAGNAQLLLRRPETLSAEARVKIERILEAAKRIQRVTAKMATLIQATSKPYPGEASILDVHRSLSREDVSLGSALFPTSSE